jgi:hypothetical protein
MGSLVDELRRREGAALAEACRLRGLIEELSGDLARAEEQASRLAIAVEEVTRVLEGPVVPVPDGEPAAVPRPASPAGALLVPQWHEGAVASALPRPYQDLLEVAAGAGRPLRAAEFCTATGLATGKAQVEGARSRLRRLAARGWLAEEPGGLYSPGAYAGKASSGGR